MDCPWTSIGHSVTGTTEKLTEADYVAFFHQFLGLTNNPALASLANVQCPCQQYLMGGDGAWDHINCCPRHSANWFTAHEHVLQALERICQAAGYATSRKRVLTSEGNRRANLEVCSIRVAGKTDLLIDITLGHDFICAGRSGRTQGWLRNPDNPDRILENAASDNIRTYREPYQRNRQVAFLQACMSTSGRIHGEFLRLLFFLSHKQADDYFAPLGYEAHKEEFCHHRGVFFRPQQVHHWAGVRPGCIAPWCPNLRPSLHLPVPRRAGVW